MCSTTLCTIFNYLTSGRLQRFNAWPNVKFNFSFTGSTLRHFRNADFLASLPYELQVAWLNYIGMIGLNYRKTPLFRELTKNIINFINYCVPTTVIFHGESFMDCSENFLLPAFVARLLTKHESPNLPIFFQSSTLVPQSRINQLKKIIPKHQYATH